jgi:amino acid transporter
VADTPPLKKFKANWTTWAKGGAWLSTLVMSFALQPPGDIGTAEAVNAKMYARFLLAILTGLFAVLTELWKRPKLPRLWFAASVVCAAVSVVSVFAYQDAVERRTTSYDGKQIVIGSELTPVGARGLRPGVLPKDLVMDAGGNVAMVWTADSIRQNSIVVFGTWLLVMISGALCVLLLLEAARRAQRG